MKRPRVVIDTNVVVAALRSKRGASYRLLFAIEKGSIESCLSVPLFLEYQHACKRLGKESPLDETDIDDVLDFLCRQADHVRVFYLWRPFLPDPNDDMLLDLAVAGGCDYIVSHNVRHLSGVEEFG